MAIEMFIVHNRVTQFIENSGEIDRDNDLTNQQGKIDSLLAANPNLDALYLDIKGLPDGYEEEVNEQKIRAEVNKIARATAVQNLKDIDELPPDYTAVDTRR